MCYINGCECPTGTVIDVDKRECVAPSECEGMHSIISVHGKEIAIMLFCCLKKTPYNFKASGYFSYNLMCHFNCFKSNNIAKYTLLCNSITPSHIRQKYICIQTHYFPATWDITSPWRRCVTTKLHVHINCSFICQVDSL